MIPSTEILLRLLLGALIGGIVGFERELHGRAAGFRTQLIVCVASVLIMIVSENYYYYIRDLDSTLRIDPARISAGALIGIGFLGAGVIIKSGATIRGLTTAASIWIVSAIGLAIGGGLYMEGVATFFITIIALIILRIFEKKIKTQSYKILTVSTPASEDSEETIASLITESGFNIHSIDYEKTHPSNEIIYHFSISTWDRKAKGRIFRKLNSQEFIHSIDLSG